MKLDPSAPKIAGSFGNSASLAEATLAHTATACDVVEIRLDLLDSLATRPWTHLAGLPLLFTARRGDEGGGGNLSASERAALLDAVIEEASLIDVEIASAAEMSDTLGKARSSGVPWVASWHDFEGRPESFARVPTLAVEAAEAGAACFKAAIRLHHPGDVLRLAGLLELDLPVPLSLMGMGPLAPVSRLLCAQLGSVLNYGYLGDAPTAPGQWSAALLKAAVAASATGIK